MVAKQLEGRGKVGKRIGLVGVFLVALLGLVTACEWSPPPGAELPVTRFSATPAAGTAPLVVDFNAGGSYSMIGGGLRYQWDFGDGSPLTPPSEGIETMMLSHAYQEPGTYNATLHVFDDDNAEGTCTQTISVVGPKGTVGSTISNGFEEVTLIGVRTTSLVADLAPPPMKIYVVADVRVRAVAGRIFCRSFQLLDASGRAKYESAFNSLLDDSFVCGILSTGEEESGELLFEVSPSSSYTLLYDAEYSEQPITFGFEI